ncbi:Amino acid polyamine transporter I protein [Rutstroemia sp. NJR-2017a BBW]|nr:Amino acid polyamine transporter I protein [Rutstroemia sp. NJR-2017a BBW]
MCLQMSEEISNPSLNVPRAIVFSVLLNGTLGFGMLLAALFCLGDIEYVLSTPTGYPFMAIFQQAVGSLPGALTMAGIITIMNICATISFVATASRMTWSFARDRGVPGWQYLSIIEKKTTLPLVSIAMTATISVLLSLIGLGSVVAFNDVVSLSINGLYTSYLIGNGFLLYRRVTGGIQSYSPSRKSLSNTMNSDLSWGPWKIAEPFGTIVNAFGCLYLTVILLFSFFPVTVNPSPASMNYSSLMTGAVSIFAIVFYFLYGNKIYKGPIDLNKSGDLTGEIEM